MRIDDLRTPAFELRGVDARLDLSGSHALKIVVARLSAQGRTWNKISLTCPATRLTPELIECPRGTLDLDGVTPIAFFYRPRARAFELALLPASQERWELSGRLGGSPSPIGLRVLNGELTRLNRWVAPNLPRFSAGVVSGEGRWSAARVGAHMLELKGQIDRAAFSDEAGLRAGENISGNFTLHAAGGAWEMVAAWREGEMFWQPLYLPSSQRTLRAHGTVDAQSFSVQDATLSLARVGDIRFTGVWDRRLRQLKRLSATGSELRLSGLYETFLKPLWVDRMLGHLAVDGGVSGRVEIADGRLRDIDLSVRDTRVVHDGGLFELKGVQGKLPWSREGNTLFGLSVGGGHVRGVPLGGFALAGEARPDGMQLDQLHVPVLDGALMISGFQLAEVGGEWSWQASAAVRPISMDRLSQALKWPRMEGTFSGVVPSVSYAKQNLSVDGALLFKVFDGSIVVKDLQIRDFLSPANRAYANVDMRGLDLDFLTRAFSFGSIQGRIDATIRNLQLAAWRPVRFDARVGSSAGDYPRKISQRAVENIAALGGASAGAALQRSFLRFFEQFSYDSIGLSCQLENTVCTMGGIEDTNHGYVIVKGGGIPALSVIGYNRQVGWNELLARLARVRQRGVKPIVE